MKKFRRIASMILAGTMLICVAASSVCFAENKGIPDEIMFPYYGLLSENGKAAYKAVLSGIEAADDSVELEPGIGVEEAKKILDYIFYDQPQLFWYEPGGCQIYSDGRTGYAVRIFLGYNDLKYNLESSKAEVCRAAEEILQNAKQLAPWDAAMLFHDYICSTTEYGLEEYDQNIYSALVLHRSVCAGYARAFQYLMQQYGIPCGYCTGTAKSGSSEQYFPHAWNIVKLSEKYYNCDVTFDDFCNEPGTSPSYIDYTNFMVSDDGISIDHRRDENGLLLPSCTSDDMTYRAVKGEDWQVDYFLQGQNNDDNLIDSLDQYFDFVRDRVIENGEGTVKFTIMVRNSDVMDQIKNVSGEEFGSRAIEPAADALGKNGWSYSYSVSSYTSDNQYYYLDYELEFR